MPAGPYIKKFNIVSNHHRWMQKHGFSVLDQKYPFWANLLQKIKIVSSSWNLVPRLIRVCRMKWCCSLFFILTVNTLFMQIWQKKNQDKFEYAEVNCTVHLLLTGNTLFGQIWSKKIEIVSLTLFRMGGKKSPLPVFFPVTSLNVGISPLNFSNFSFNSFATLA